MGYFKTYASVIRYESVRAPLAFAVQEKAHLHHIDIKTAFLHANLHVPIFVEQPLGFEDPQHPSKEFNSRKQLMDSTKPPIYGTVN